MRSRLRGRLCRMPGFLRRLLLRDAVPPPAPPPLRGKMRRAVVVPSPDAHFTEVVYLLRDELLREPGLSREELLREAARAAESCTSATLPPSPRPALRPAAAFLLGSLGTLLVLRLLGIL